MDMPAKLSRDELVDLVRRVISLDNPDEVDDLIETLQDNLPDPSVTDLIYSDDDLSAEEIVDKALAYKRIRLE